MFCVHIDAKSESTYQLMKKYSRCVDNVIVLDNRLDIVYAGYSYGLYQTFTRRRVRVEFEGLFKDSTLEQDLKPPVLPEKCFRPDSKLTVTPLTDRRAGRLITY